MTTQPESPQPAPELLEQCARAIFQLGYINWERAEEYARACLAIAPRATRREALERAAEIARNCTVEQYGFQTRMKIHDAILAEIDTISPPQRLPRHPHIRSNDEHARTGR